MKKIVLTVALLALAVALSLGQQPRHVQAVKSQVQSRVSAQATIPSMSTPKIVVHSPADSRWAQVALGPDGIAHIIYELDYTGFANSKSEIWYSSYNGTKTSTPLYLGRGGRPAIASSSKGTLVVVAQDNTNQIWMKKYDAKQKAWLDMEIVAERAYMGFEPQVTIDPDENIYVLFYSDTMAMVWARSKIDGVWDSLTRVDRGSAKHCAITSGRDGRVWASWREKIGAGGNYKLVYSKRTKSTPWTGARTVTDRGASASHHHMWVNNDNMCIIGFSNVNEEVGFGGEMRVLWLDENTNPYQTVIPMGLRHYPVVAVDTNNVIHLACQVGGGDYGDGVAYVNNAPGNKFGDSTWTEPVQYGGIWDKIPGMWADPFGNVVMVWSSLQDDPTTPEADMSVVWLSSILPVTPKKFDPPVSLGVSIALRSAFRAPAVVYNLSWSANPDNTADFLQGYRIYLSENAGPYTAIQDVTVATTSAALSFNDLAKKRTFGITTVTKSGIESSMVLFQ